MSSNNDTPKRRSVVDDDVGASSNAVTAAEGVGDYHLRNEGAHQLDVDGFLIAISKRKRSSIASRHRHLLFIMVCTIFIYHDALTAITALSTISSPIVSTKWNLMLDVGMQQGSWMPRRFPGWAESGARLPLNVNVEFTKQPSTQRESLVGTKDSTYILKVCNNDGNKPFTYISERGLEEVTFTDGGWCIHQPTGNIKNAEGTSVKPEGLLRFWLDCPSGAKKQDAEVFPNTRIFFTTGVWEDVTLLKDMQVEYDSVVDNMQTLIDQTRGIIQENNEQISPDDSSKKNSNIIERINDYRSMVDSSEDFDALASRKEELERASPPLGCAEADNGVKIAPTGSLVIKGNKIPDWLPGSEYLILGTFSTKAY